MKKYAVSAVTIDNTAGNYSLGTYSTHPPEDISLDISIQILDSDAFYKAISSSSSNGNTDAVEAVEKFLENNTIPEWASNKMIHKALKAMYPEQYL